MLAGLSSFDAVLRRAGSAGSLGSPVDWINILLTPSAAFAADAIPPLHYWRLLMF